MSETRTYTVTGMSCGHCESAVREEIEALEGVAGISVSAAEASLSLTVEEPTAGDEAVLAAVEEAGYVAERVS